MIATFLFVFYIPEVISQTTFQRVYQIAGAFDDGQCVAQHDDGGYVIASRGIDCSYDVMLLRTDPFGTEISRHLYDGGRCGWDKVCSLVKTSDGGFIALGQVEEKFYLIRTDSNGDSLWKRIYDQIDGNMYAYSDALKQTNDGGFIVAGCIWTDEGWYSDYFLLKTDANGDTMWTKIYHCHHNEEAVSVQQTEDGGYIIVGTRGDINTNIGLIYLLKTDANGDISWERPMLNHCTGHTVRQTDDGGYVIGGGFQETVDPPVHGLLVKTSKIGILEWYKTYEGRGVARFNNLCMTNDGGYLLSGYTISEAG